MTTAIIATTPYNVTFQNGRHSFSADEPRDLGGGDKGPTPDELLEASLAGCTAITLRMYADRKKWPVAGIEVTVSLERTEGKTLFTKNIQVNGTIDETQRQRLLEIAKICPVSKTLLGEISIESRVS